MSEDIDLMRKTPSQKRAGVTIDTIFEATAQILERGEQAKLTTNHIAERAGYSVGTLYGYFPNKASLLRAMALKEMKKQEGELLAMLAKAGPEASEEDLVRMVIGAALRPFGKRSRLRMAMFRVLSKDPNIMRAILSVQDHALDVFLDALARRRGVTLMPSPSARFTMFASVAGAVQTALLEQPELFETSAFEDELVVLMLGYLQRF
jgi:AcrR family transcriptional regulator